MLNMCKLYKRDLLIRIQLFVPKWHLKKLASYTYFCNFHDICKGLPSRRLSQLMQLWNYQERTELLNRILPRFLNLRKYILNLIPSSKKKWTKLVLCQLVCLHVFFTIQRLCSLSCNWDDVQNALWDLATFKSLMHFQSKLNCVWSGWNLKDLS
jgi:hypothetical protein